MSVGIFQRLIEHIRDTGPRRLRAAGIHFSLSALVFVVALYLILAHWFPGFHFVVDGGWQGTRLVAAVDLVLGPTLTLLIFNPLKARRLIVFDLACIGMAQLAALGWGFYAIHSQRPVSVNFYDGTFSSITAEPIEAEKYPLSILDALSDRKPALIYVAPPANVDEQTRAAMMEMVGGAPEYADPLRFKKFLPNWDTVRARAKPLTVPDKERPEFALARAEFLAKRGGAVADYLYFPFSGRYGECTLAFSQQGELLEALDCRAF